MDFGLNHRYTVTVQNWISWFCFWFLRCSKNKSILWFLAEKVQALFARKNVFENYCLTYTTLNLSHTFITASNCRLWLEFLKICLFVISISLHCLFCYVWVAGASMPLRHNSFCILLVSNLKCFVGVATTILV